MRHKLDLRYNKTSESDVLDLSFHSSSDETVLYMLGHAWARCSKGIMAEEELIIGMKGISKRKQSSMVEHLLLLREISETTRQSNRFTSFIIAFRVVTENIRANNTTTRRDIFYRDVEGFVGSQCNSNVALESVATSFNLSITDDLRVFPSPKGLIWGGPSQVLMLEGRESLFLSFQNNYSLIPHIPTKSAIALSDEPCLILVFEKESVFKSFTEFVRSKSVQESLLILCGKGYPDEASRTVLMKLKHTFKNVPVLLFVDSDIYGARICWSYLQRLREYAQNVVLGGVFIIDYEAGCLTLADREWRLTINFLIEVKDSEISSIIPSKTVSQIHRELTRCLLIGKKAEMNVISAPEVAYGLNTYIWRKVTRYASR